MTNIAFVVLTEANSVPFLVKQYVSLLWLVKTCCAHIGASDMITA